MSFSNPPRPPRTTPPSSAADKSSTVGKVPPYFIQHKRDQVQAFDKNVQQTECITEQQFFNCLGFGDKKFPPMIPNSLQPRPIEGFCDLANGIAQYIQQSNVKNFPNDHLLEFQDTGNKTPNGHVTGTKCRPDITAASKKEWEMYASRRASRGASTDWEIIRLAGEKASTNESLPKQKKHAATYLHYLLLARPDLLVAQGLLTTESEITFLVGIGGVGIKEFTVNWHDKNLSNLLYAFIYRLYDPSDFADPSYMRTGFDEKTSQAIYTVKFKEVDYPNFRSIHARNPFTTRTHVLSNPEHTVATVIKGTLCRSGRRFDEKTILSKIHETMKVPGVVEVVDGEIGQAAGLCPGRRKHSLGLRQTGSPFTSIPTAKKVLETLFDLLEVLRFLRFERKILHRDISVGNVMYLENPEILAQDEVEPLVFAKYLLGDSKVRHETSLLLVDFNLGEDLENKKDGFRIERTGTPIFISRAVEQGRPVPLNWFLMNCPLPGIPKSPECYTKAHQDRIEDVPEQVHVLEDPFNQTQNEWRHELDHDVESVFWLFLYWAIVAQPKGSPGESIDAPTWTSLLGNFEARDLLIFGLASGKLPDNLTHSVYKPLSSLISSLAAILVIDRRWLPKSNVRKRPEYICEAFQRLILQFIISNRNEDFMTCRVGKSLRQVQETAQSQALSTTPSLERDGSERVGSHA